MMSSRVNIKNILILAGTMEILVGLLHFAMPYFVYQTEGFQILNNIESNFISLLIYAVGILLVSFGFLSLLFAFHLKSMQNILFYYLIIKASLWAARVVLELVYPVELNMFYIEKFTVIVLPGLFFEALLFILAIILFKHKGLTQ